MNLTPPQIKWLKWLHENGGSGYLDPYGRVIANGARSPQGTQTAWLNLFIKRMVCARDQRVVLTELGRAQIGLPVETKPDPRSDKALLDWLESECANLTCVDEHGQDDVSVSWQVTLPVRLRPDEPADAYGTSPRQVIDYAMREQEIRERDLVK